MSRSIIDIVITVLLSILIGNSSLCFARKDTVKYGSLVSLEYSIKDPTGQTLYSNTGGKSVSIVVGDGLLPDSFEESLIGLTEGEAHSFVIPAEYAFGHYKEKHIRINKKSNVRPGANIIISDKLPNARDSKVIANVVAINANEMLLNLMHPLSGIDLEYNVIVRSVK